MKTILNKSSSTIYLIKNIAYLLLDAAGKSRKQKRFTERAIMTTVFHKSLVLFVIGFSRKSTFPTGKNVINKRNYFKTNE